MKNKEDIFKREFSIDQKMSLDELSKLLPGVIDFKKSNLCSEGKNRLYLKLNFIPVIPRIKFKNIEEIKEKFQNGFLSLTKREKEVISLIIKGYGNIIIADELFISRRTVEQHRKNIRKKIKYKDEYELFLFAKIFGL
jgi:two-component system response regulator NreC